MFVSGAGHGRRFVVMWAVGSLAGVSAFWAVPYLLIHLFGGFDPGTAEVMPEVLGIASGASVVLAAFFTGLAWHATYRDADRAGTRLRIDGSGVYLGGRRPRPLPWDEVGEVVLLTHTVTGEYGDAVSHVVVFRCGEPVGSGNPFDWGPHREVTDHADPFAALREVVAAHRPGLAIRELGDVPFHHRTRFL